MLPPLTRHAFAANEEGVLPSETRAAKAWHRTTSCRPTSTCEGEGRAPGTLTAAAVRVRQGVASSYRVGLIAYLGCRAPGAVWPGGRVAPGEAQGTGPLALGARDRP